MLDVPAFTKHDLTIILKLSRFTSQSLYLFLYPYFFFIFYFFQKFLFRFQDFAYTKKYNLIYDRLSKERIPFKWLLFCL